MWSPIAQTVRCGPPMSEHEAWHLKGTVFIACNCDYGCPCNFNALPTQGYCEGQWTWHVEEGRFGETPLDGLNFTVAVKWPGAIHEGDGEGVILVDERADDAERAATDHESGQRRGRPPRCRPAGGDRRQAGRLRRIQGLPCGRRYRLRP